MWKLSEDNSKIVEGDGFHQIVEVVNGVNLKTTPILIEDDQIFNIITSTMHFGQNWIKRGMDFYCNQCNMALLDERDNV